MAAYLFDQAAVKKELEVFFTKEKANVNNFGNTVNQTFEANVFANVIKWYKTNGWDVNIINPLKNGKYVFNLKFNTRGAPINYSYARCIKHGKACQIRHGLRTHTYSYKTRNKKSANIVCDIVVMSDVDIDHFTTDTALQNKHLISFGEVKHMSAYAELMANFIGLVFELRPDRLRRIRVKKWVKPDNIACFMYVSGILYKTAEGLLETFDKRKYDIDIYSFNNPML